MPKPNIAIRTLDLGMKLKVYPLDLIEAGASLAREPFSDRPRVIASWGSIKLAFRVGPDDSLLAYQRLATQELRHYLNTLDDARVIYETNYVDMSKI